MQKIVEFLHTAPLFLIAAMYFFRSSFSGKSSFTAAARKFLSSDSHRFVILQLVLASIGVASGTNSHHEHGSLLHIIDPCIAYSAIILLSATKVGALSKVAATVRVNKR